MKGIVPIIISEASAGSGKTELLTRHFVSLLILTSKDSPDGLAKTDRILAITFTNEAATEMKQRILEWLKRAALGDKEIIGKIKDHILKIAGDSKTTHSSITPTEKEISRLALNNIEHILNDYYALKVNTIDSFVNSIAASSALEMDLPPNYEIISDVPPHIGAAVDEMLSSVSSSCDEKHPADEDVPGLIEKFLRSYFYLEREKGWNPRDAIYENIKFLYDEENHRGKEFRASGLDESKIFSMREEVIKRCYDAALKCPNKRSRDSMIKRLSSSNKQEALEELTPAQIEYIPPKTRELFAEFYEKYSSLRYDSYINLYVYFRRILENYKKMRRIVFISDLNSRVASRLIALEIPSVYFMLGERIEHFLVDEFQDTSEIQWRNIKPLAENSISSGGSLFYVGDKKQSLYRWRGGRARLFNIASDEVAPEDVTRRTIYLDKNYRSSRAIVDFVNESFSVDNLARLGLSPQYLSSYQKVKQELPDNRKNEISDPSDVKLTKITASDSEELDEKVRDYVLSSVKEILSSADGKFTLKDIAVLTRRNEEVGKITQWLMAESYPVVSTTSMSLKENTTVAEIISFLKVLVSPSDNVAFASLVTGKLFRNFSALSEKEVSDFLLTYRARKRKRMPEGESLYEIFRREYPEIWRNLFEEFSRLAGYMTPYDIVSLYLSKTSAFSICAGEEIYFLRLLEILNEYEGGRINANSIRGFLDYWEADESGDEARKEIFEVKLPAAGELNALRVLTIHKAKGLGFPAVIMPFKPALESENKIVIEYDNSDGGVGYLSLNYIIQAYTRVSSRLKEVYDNEEREKLLDEINSLYVGATRARKKLRIAFLKTPRIANPFMEIFEENCPLDKILDSLPQTTSIPLFPTEISTLEDNSKSAGRKTSVWWEKIASDKKSPGIDIIVANDYRLSEIERGTILHKILSCVTGPIPVEDNKEELERFLSIMTEKVLSQVKNTTVGISYPSCQDIVGKTLLPMFEMEEFALWFSRKGENEKEIAEPQRGRIFRIDRLVEIDGTIYVIDYKTGEEYDDKHIEQIEHYGELVLKIFGPSKKIALRLAYIDEKRIIKV